MLLPDSNDARLAWKFLEPVAVSLPEWLRPVGESPPLGESVAQCDDVNEKFADLREHFLNRKENRFDLQDVLEQIRTLAREGQKVAYRDLMRRHHITRARTRGIAEVLWAISEKEACLVGSAHDPPHFITAIVVRASTGYPSGGFFGLAGMPSNLRRGEGRYQDADLTVPEMRYVERIWEHLPTCRKSGA